MTTGKTDEPEPDYVRIEAEFTRLEREVIEAAKEWRKDIIVDEPLRVAVDALLAFEANQKNEL